MILSTKYKHKNVCDLELKINGSNIENVSVKKILGIYIDNRLSWNFQINKVCSKLNSKVALLKRISYYLSNEMKKLFYNAYIMSSFDFCCTVWGKRNKSGATTIFKIQKRAAQIILNKSRDTSCYCLYTRRPHCK